MMKEREAPTAPREAPKEPRDETSTQEREALNRQKRIDKDYKDYAKRHILSNLKQAGMLHVYVVHSYYWSV